MTDSNLEFLQAVTSRVGPVNAVGLMKDATINAFRQLFSEIGIPKERVDKVINHHLQKTAQTVMSMPSPSPYPRQMGK